MQFTQRFWEPIRRGELTLTFRRWKRRQVVAGNRYRTGGGIVEVTSLDVVDPASITDRDARRAGFASADELRGDLRGSSDLPTYRVAFHVVDEPDPRTVLAEADTLTAEEVDEIDTRLDRLDRAADHGPWTRQVLALIAEHPATRAGDLAPRVDRGLAPFKLDVRKLKNLGLTISLSPGYRLSPRGEAYLRTRSGP